MENEAWTLYCEMEFIYPASYVLSCLWKQTHVKIKENSQTEKDSLMYWKYSYHRKYLTGNPNDKQSWNVMWMLILSASILRPTFQFFFIIEGFYKSIRQNVSLFTSVLFG